MAWKKGYTSQDGIKNFEQEIVSVLTVLDGRKMHIVGTGFIVSALKRQAICLTAKHVFEEIYRLQNSDNEIPTSNIFSKAPEQIDLTEWIEKGRLKIFYGQSGVYELVKITALNFVTPTDVAIFVVELPENTRFKFDRKPGINTDILPQGTEVILISYANHNLDVVDFNVNATVYEFTRKLEIRHGKISEVSLIGGPLVKGPVYILNVPCDAGMSGGPVYLYDATMQGPKLVIGLVSSDMSDLQSFYDESIDGHSYISAILNCVALSVRDQNHKNVTLLDLIRRGFIKDYGTKSSKIRLQTEADGSWKITV